MWFRKLFLRVEKKKRLSCCCGVFLQISSVIQNNVNLITPDNLWVSAWESIISTLSGGGVCEFRSHVKSARMPFTPRCHAWGCRGAWHYVIRVGSVINPVIVISTKWRWMSPLPAKTAPFAQVSCLGVALVCGRKLLNRTKVYWPLVQRRISEFVLKGL